MPRVLYQTPVKFDTVDLLVFTTKTGFRRYTTAVVDQSANREHAGKTLPGHEFEYRTYGPYVVGFTQIFSSTRKEARNQHREALYAARTETPA